MFYLMRNQPTRPACAGITYLPPRLGQCTLHADHDGPHEDARKAPRLDNKIKPGTEPQWDGI